MTAPRPKFEATARKAIPSSVGWKVVILIGTTCAFGLAGYITSQLVPTGHMAAMEISSSDGSSLPHDLTGTGANEAPVIERKSDGVLLISATASTVAKAESLIVRSADRVAALFDEEARKRSPVSPSAVSATNQAPTVVATPVLPASSDVSAGLALLNSSAQQATRDADRLQDEIDKLPSRKAVSAEQLTSAQAKAAAAQAELANITRLRDAVARARAPEATAVVKPPPPGWPEWVRLSQDRDRLREQIAELSRTLLDGHPRMAMARLRLADLDQQVSDRKATILRNLDARLASAQQTTLDAAASLRRLQQKADADAKRERERSELQGRHEVALRLAERLQAAVAAAETSDETKAPPALPPVVQPTETAVQTDAPTAKPPPVLVRTWLPPQTLHADPLPVAAASGVIGLLAVSTGMLASRRRRGGERRMASPKHEDALASRTAPIPEAIHSHHDITPIDDVIDAAIATKVTRFMLTGDEPASGLRPMSVNIARRLSLRGQSVALVDLSTTQSAARTMGVAADAPSINDLIEGNANFAAIAARDFATQAEVVPGGLNDRNLVRDMPHERRNVLDFVENSYEAIIVDCTGMAPEGVAALMDPDAALLVSVDPSRVEAAYPRIERLERTGLTDMILVSETRTA